MDLSCAPAIIELFPDESSPLIHFPRCVSPIKPCCLRIFQRAASLCWELLSFSQYSREKCPSKNSFFHHSGQSRFSCIGYAHSYPSNPNRHLLYHLYLPPVNGISQTARSTCLVALPFLYRWGNLRKLGEKERFSGAAGPGWHRDLITVKE